MPTSPTAQDRPGAAPAEAPFGVTRAPDFPADGVAWFNVDRPLSLAALRGRGVVLHFWTAGCVNCLHVLPALRRVEEAFAGRVVVIGVHSPKFTAEREDGAVARAVRREGIRHPVVSDPGMRIWQAYAVRAWPTLVFVSPEGRVVGHAAGEPDPDRLLAAVGRLAEGAAPGEVLAGGEGAAPAAGRFSFPAKIRAVPGSTRRWAVADAGHHQIVLLDEKGAEMERYGAGAPGFEDGLAGEARFAAPQGVACDHDALYVADTGNHALRRIDLLGEGVTTLTGIGRRGALLPAAPEPGAATALASPWDVETVPGGLAFANAGTHQLGLFDIRARTVRRLAGSGVEGLGDGPADSAQMAQPSGLAVIPDGRALIVADAESSAIRRVDLGSGAVTTLAGAGLFAFGHVDGGPAEARFQHPLGVAVLPDGAVLVADTYNGALRRLDAGVEGGAGTGARAGTVAGFAADFACEDAVCLPLSEPAGLAFDPPDHLLVVDTGNARILRFDLVARTYRTWSS